MGVLKLHAHRARVIERELVCMHLVLLLCCLLLAVVHLEAMQSAAPLHFRHGAVSSAKSLNLLAVAHSYKVQGKTALVMKVLLIFVR